MGDFAGSCGPENYPPEQASDSGADFVFTFTPETSGALMVDTLGSDYDTLVYVRTTCTSDASEIGCNDDYGDYQAGEVQSELGIADGAVAGETLYIIVDGFNAEAAGAFTVSARVVEATAPVIDEMDAYTIDADNFVIRVTGSDAEGDAATMGITLLDADGAVIEIGDPPDVQTELYFAPEMEGDVEFEAVMQLGGLSSFPEAVGVRVTMIDVFEGRSESVDGDFVELPRVAVDGACDTEDVFMLCEIGALCTEGVCVADEPPTLDWIEARIIDVEGGVYRISGDGSDPSGNVSGFQVTFLDSDGDEIMADGSYWGSATEFAVGTAWSLEDETDFLATGNIYTVDFWTGTDFLPEGATGVSVALLDTAGNTSDAIDAQWIEMPEIAADAECDPVGAVDMCVEGLTCDFEDEICLDLGGEVCGGALRAITSGTPVTVELEEVVDAPNSYYPVGSIFAGSCAGRGPEEVLMLEVAAASSITVTTSGDEEGADTVLYIRSACGDTESELDCNDDTEEDLYSSVTVESADAGTYYIFADTYGSAATFTVTATVTPL